MTTAEVLREAAARGIILRAEAGRVKGTAPSGTCAEALRAGIRERKADLLAILQPPGLPLQPPDYDFPVEWQPAPEWTPDELEQWRAERRAMAAAVSDVDLADWVIVYGSRLYLDEKGHLRAENAGGVPAELREEVRRRQAALAALLAGETERQ